MIGRQQSCNSYNRQRCNSNIRQRPTFPAACSCNCAGPWNSISAETEHLALWICRGPTQELTKLDPHSAHKRWPRAQRKCEGAGRKNTITSDAFEPFGRTFSRPEQGHSDSGIFLSVSRTTFRPGCNSYIRQSCNCYIRQSCNSYIRHWWPCGLTSCCSIWLAPARHLSFSSSSPFSSPPRCPTSKASILCSCP